MHVAPTPARSRRRAGARPGGACASRPRRAPRPTSVSSRCRSPADDDEPVALHPGHGLAHRGPALPEALGDPCAQRDDALLLEFVDRPEVHLGGIDELVHNRPLRFPHRIRTIRPAPSPLTGRMTAVTSPTPQFTAPLLEPAHLAALLRSAAGGGVAPVVLDVRWRLGGPAGRADHEAGHMPGAVFVDLDTELAAPPGPRGRHPLPDAGALQAALRRAGVSQESRVVAYDDGTGAVAARAWWLLRWAGLPADRVAVLDGGFRAWVADGPAGHRDAEPARSGRRRGAPRRDAGARRGRGGGRWPATACCSTRGRAPATAARPSRSTPGPGTSPGAERAGHRTPRSGRAVAAPDGARPALRGTGRRSRGGRADRENGSAEVGAYCGSGVNAAAVVLALEYAGLRPAVRPAALYPGPGRSGPPTRAGPSRRSRAVSGRSTGPGQPADRLGFSP